MSANPGTASTRARGRGLRPLVTVACACAAMIALPRQANADAAAAEALFREGRRLLDEGRVDLACAKLAESQAQDPSSGTLLNLALCHEKQGKLATAWAEYAAATRLATAQGRVERATAAAKLCAELEPRLARVTLTMNGVPPGVTVRLAGETRGADALNASAPVDSGPHELRVTAPGYEPWSTIVDVRDGEKKTVPIPPLTLSPTVARPRAMVSRLPSRSADRPSSTAYSWFLGIGVAALGVGAGFAASAVSSYRDAERACPTHKDCSPEALSLRARAEGHAWVANIALAGGLVGAGAGMYLMLRTRSRDRATALAVVPSLTAVRIEGTF